MTTTQEVNEWVQAGLDKGADYLIVACDTFDYGDFPVYVMPHDSLEQKKREYNDHSKMLRIMEVIDLR